MFNKFKIQKLIYFVLILIVICSLDLILTYLNHYLDEINNYSFYFIAERTFVYGIIREVANVLISGNITDILDDGRINQIIGIKEYLVTNDFLENLFGTYSGSHRFNLTNYITSDTSGVLRPIGIVVLIYDWGLLFLFIYFALILYNLKKINSFIKHDKAKNLIILIIYLYISLNPLITNMNDSILFWLIIFFPINFLVRSLIKINI